MGTPEQCLMVPLACSFSYSTTGGHASDRAGTLTRVAPMWSKAVQDAKPQAAEGRCLPLHLRPADSALRSPPIVAGVSPVRYNRDSLLLPPEACEPCIRR